ncbi:DUF6285 domain-containing protein [Spongiibacter sp.]|uniref:DUF6285 domain-containing protein n=1 Tax=Spongiibacter sp. TaxID=2024860 RepID=UPI003561D97B
MSIEHPNAEQLGDAIADFLRNSLLPAVDNPSLKYQLRVAINGLGIMQRELASGAEQAERERRLLAAYLGEDAELEVLREKLVAAMSVADQPYRDEKLLAVLKEISEAKLAIDNPRYRPVGS